MAVRRIRRSTWTIVIVLPLLALSFVGCDALPPNSDTDDANEVPTAEEVADVLKDDSEFLESVEGEKGEKGDNGDQGDPGLVIDDPAEVATVLTGDPDFLDAVRPRSRSASNICAINLLFKRLAMCVPAEWFHVSK